MTKGQRTGRIRGLVGRDSFPTEISANVFNAVSGEILGPFASEKVFHLILLDKVIKSELNDAIKEAIKEKILQEWVSQFLRGDIKVVDLAE